LNPKAERRKKKDEIEHGDAEGRSEKDRCRKVFGQGCGYVYKSLVNADECGGGAVPRMIQPCNFPIVNTNRRIDALGWCESRTKKASPESGEAQ
jgi:hypothetical protein